MNWLKHNFWDLLFVIVFLSLTFFISFKNYTPGTWLTGWDNLHPEFNFYLNIKRSIFAVWQEYQGVGLLGGMDHAADLPRQLILWGLSYVIPVNFLRYFWTFAMLTVGPIGVYFLVSRNLIKDEGFLKEVSGFVAGILYLFNLATLQTFYTPFETFTAFYGLFPWLLYFAIGYLNTHRTKDLFKYFLFGAVAVCAFYVQTLSVVYAIFLSVIVVEKILTSPKSGIVLSIKLALTTFCVNAFWLLPVVYFATVSGGVPGASHINSIATPETQMMNQARGTLPDIAALKGYWFDYYDWNTNGGYYYLYKDWITHLSNPLFDKITLIFFGIASTGLFFAIFKKKITFRFSFLFLGIVSYFMLAGSNPPFGKWFDQITQIIPLFGEIFRNAFTKWATATSLIYAIGIGLFVYIVSDIFKSKFKYFLAILLSTTIVAGSIYVTSPFFEGKLINQSMKVNTPQEYFDLFNYLKTQDPTKRVADFPMLNFWGWDFYKWGYRGSGFIWYGIEQPILDRTFDVWSGNNEVFYKEANYAIAYGTTKDFEQVLQKYQVGFIIFDESIYDPGNHNTNVIIQKQKQILETSKVISKNKTFGNVTLYDVDLNVKPKAFVSASGDLPESVSLSAVKDTDLPIPSGKPAIAESFPSLQGYPFAKNCDLSGRGGVTKETKNNGNMYLAKNGGVSCDYFYYPTIDYSKTYVMHLEGENVSGRSLKFYLFNVKSGLIDRVELLSKGKFNNYYLMLPTGKGKDGGYTLNVETRSYGNVESQNRLETVEFYEVDSNYLNTFKDTVLHGDSNTGDLQIKNVQKHGTWLYKVDVQGDGLIQLGQGYDQGWIAFPTLNYKLQIYKYQINLQIPNIKNELKHEKINSWANGWIVEGNRQQALDSRSDGSSNANTLVPSASVFIVFWPQLLEWGGALLGIITFLYIIGKRKIKNG